MKNNNDFNFIIPAEISKGKDGEWKIRGLACTENKDRQGEIILQKGIDLSPVDSKKGWLNYEHSKLLEDRIGTLDGYAKTDKGLVIEGRLFKAHKRAQAVYEIMQSLGENDKGRIGLSVEGSVLERDAFNPKIIKKCQIRNCAVTFNPVNTDTYADLIKGFNASEVEFEATEENALLQEAATDEPVFTVAQVSALLKSLGITVSYATFAPNAMTGGDALSMQSFDPKSKKEEDEDDKPENDPVIIQDKQEKKNMKKLPKLSKALYKASMISIMDKLQELYPEVEQSTLWACVKERMNTQYPEINDEK